MIDFLFPTFCGIIFSIDLEKVIEKLKDVVINELKAELKDFKTIVTSQLNSFGLAIESINSRISGMESRMVSIETALIELRRAIDETNKRIDDINATLSNRIDETNKRIDDINKRIDDMNKRIDETNKRIDDLFLEVSTIRGDLKKALSEKESIDDVLIRIQRLEGKVLNIT